MVGLDILFRALGKFKDKQTIMTQTGNTGPPDTDYERLLRYFKLEICEHLLRLYRSILSVEESAGANRRIAPSGRQSRPVMLDPQPISMPSSNM